MAFPAKKDEGIDVALVLGGDGPSSGKKPKRKAPPMAEPEGDEGAGEAGLPPDFDVAADEFLDADRPLEERKHALKRAITACVAAREADEY